MRGCGSAAVRRGVTRRVVVALASLWIAGCERAGETTSSSEEARVAVDAPLPEHRFAEGLVSEFPEVCAFLSEFMQTCLNGDYLGYRRLVSRFETPLSRERFEAIYRAVRSVVVEEIRPLQRHTAENEPIYLVVSGVEVDPDSRVAVRHRDPRLAILVFQESGVWRMRPAPGDLLPASQPASDESPASTSAPVTYPWDQDAGG